MSTGLMRTAIVAALLLFAGGSAFFVLHLNIEHDNASMTSDDARVDEVYASFKEQFDGENELFITITNTALLTEEGARDLRAFNIWIAGLEGVHQVFSLASLQELAVTADGPMLVDFMEPTEGEDYAETMERRLAGRDDLTGTLISADKKTAGILVILDSTRDRADRHQVLSTIRRDSAEHTKGVVNLVGLPALKEDVADYIARDQKHIMPLSTLVMVLLLALIYHRFAGVLLPMSVVGLSLLGTLGLYSALQFQLNSITSLLPPVVIVLSVSAAVHVFDAWQSTIDDGFRGAAAIRRALANVWKPCVFTAAMTAVGLLSLCFSPIPAVRLFGIFAAVGVSFSVLFTFIVLPTGLAWCREIPHRNTSRHRLMDRFLGVVAITPTRWPRAILVAAALLSVCAIYGALRVENNTDLIRFFKASSTTYQAHHAVAKAMGSVRALELVIRRVDGQPMDDLYAIQQLARFSDAAEALDDVVGIESSAGFFRHLLRVIGEEEIASLDETDLNWQLANAIYGNLGADTPVMRLISPDGATARVRVQLGAVGSARAAEVAGDLRRLGRGILGADFVLEPTGAYYQIVRESNQLVSTLLRSFCVTLGIILAATGIMFRSYKVILLAFIPNTMPILWGAGIMGMAGIDLSTGTTMVAAVVIGLAIDDTIHYLYHLQYYRNRPIREATIATTRRIGHALTASSIVLVGGFWTGAFGSFIPTNHFALMTGTMMFFAWACDLFVLPASLIAVHGASENGDTQ